MPKSLPRFALLLVIGSALTGMSVPASAGCSININLKNKESVRVLVARNKAQVKSKRGTWKKLHVSREYLQPGQNISFVHQAAFGCSAKRRYRLTFVKEGHTWVEYFPSATGYSTSANVRINVKQ